MIKNGVGLEGVFGVSGPPGALEDESFSAFSAEPRGGWDVRNERAKRREEVKTLVGQRSLAHHPTNMRL